MTQCSKHLFCFGLGYTGRALGTALLKNGWKVSGTCRTPGELDALGGMKFNSFHFDGLSIGEGLKEALMSADYVLSSVPPDKSGDPVLKGFGKLLSEKENLTWLGYLSTTGVYGDQKGRHVDEDSPTDPESERGQRRVLAENGWRDLHTGFQQPVHLFRLAAIYGPQRNTLKRVLAGKARRIEMPGLMFSRIHLDDLVQVLLASIQKPNPGQVYNVADDEPAPPEEVVRFACELLKIPAPPLQKLEEAGLTPLGASFYQDSKQVLNGRIKKELGISLSFPTYREGLIRLLNTLQGPSV